MSFTRRRFVRVLTTGAAGAALLAACGGSATPTPAASKPSGGAAAATTPAGGAAAGTTPSAGAPAKQTGGNLRVWQIKLFTQSANDLSRKHITEFVQGRGGTVEVSDLPTDFIAKLIPAIEAGDVPDLVQTSSEVAQLRATGGLADVSDAVKEVTAKSGQPIKLLERAALYEGKWWGVPWFHYADAWFLRRDSFAAANIKPEDLKTFDQRRDAGLTVSNPDKQLWGWGMTMKSNTGDGDALARLHFDSWGATVTDEAGQKVIFGTTNKEAAVAALEWMADIYNNPKWSKMLPPGVMGWGGGSNNENYLGGKIAMTQNASSVYWAAKNQGSPFYKETYVAPFPAGPKQQLGGGYPYFHLTLNKAKNRDLAKEVSQFMAEEKQALERMKIAEGQSWPAYQKQIEAQAVKDFAQSDPGYAQLLENSTHPSGWTVGYPGPLTPAAAAVENQFLRAKAYEAVIAGQVKAPQAVDEMHRAAVELYKSFGLAQ